MRIETLTFQNINSLKGTWRIDFTAPEYRGLFAITGPTGAGKSSILDAIGLSLYGRTPRLGQISKSRNEVMHRGTKQCMAQTIFTAGGKRYRALWEQHRSRSSENLQQQKVRLDEFVPGASESESWIPLCEKISEFERKVPEITGLTYEQFCRSVLLAQGEFAAFLKSSDDERAVILEQITGTQIYTQISRRIQELTRERELDLDRQQALLGANPPLADEKRQELEERIKTIGQARSETQAALKAVEELIGWHAAMQTRQGDIEKNAKALELLAARSEQMNALGVRLAKAQTAESIAAQYSEQQKAQVRALTAREEKDRAQKAHAQAQRHADEAASAFTAAQKQAAAASEAHERLLAVLSKVRPLDARILSAARQTDDEKNELQLKRQNLQKLQAARGKTEQSIGRLAEAARHESEWLAEHAADRALLPLGETLITERETLKALAEALSQAARNEEEKRLAASRTREAAEKANRLLAQSEEKTKELSGQEQGARTNLTRALDGKTEQQYAAALKASEDKVRSIDAAHKENQTIQNEEKVLADRRQELERLENDRKRAALQVQALESETTLLEREETRLEELSHFLSLEDERKRLTNGSPCPLCGATEHPFAVHLPEGILSSDRELAKTRALLKKTRSRLDGERGTLSATSGKIESAQKELGRLQARIDSLAAALAAFKTEHGLASLTDLLTERDAENRRIGALEARLDSISSAEKALKAAQDALAGHKAKSEALIARAAAAKAADEAAASALLAARKERERQAEALDGRRASVLETYGNFFEGGAPQAEEALGQLSERRLAYQQAAERLAAKESDRKTLAATLAEQTNSEARAAQEEKRAAEALASSTQALSELKSDRSALFGARDADAEENASKRNMHDALGRQEQARSKAEASARDLAAALTRRDAAEKTLAELADEAQRAQAVWLQKLSEKGFPSEPLWLEARLSEADREASRKTLDQYAVDKQTAEKQKLESQEALERLVQERRTEKTPEECSLAKQSLSEKRSQLDTEFGALSRELESDRQKRQAADELLRKIEAARKEFDYWKTLNDLVGSADGKKFRLFVQGLTMARLIRLANEALSNFSDRYTLVQPDEQDDRTSPLSIYVQDSELFGERRAASNLSGGETFLVSLALALGLSKLSSTNVTIESLFLDEGFGTLDEASLENALGALDKMTVGNRLVGVISHVGRIEERIPTQIEVHKESAGASTLSGPGVQSIT